MERVNEIEYFICSANLIKYSCEGTFLDDFYYDPETFEDEGKEAKINPIFIEIIICHLLFYLIEVLCMFHHPCS